MISPLAAAFSRPAGVLFLSGALRMGNVGITFAT